MKKKLALAMACILACGCMFAACNKQKDPNSGNEPGSSNAPVKESEIPIVVSETQYLYATNPDGSYETVVATDAEGNEHTYLKGIKPGAPAEAADQTEMFEIQNSDVVGAFIDIMNSGNFCIEGYITTEGEKMPLTFRTVGKNVRMGTEISGIALDFAIIDDVTYLISEKNKSYIELTDAIKKQLGFDDNTISFDGLGEISNDDTVKTSATYNGKDVDCYTATSKEGDVKFYVDGDKLVKIEMYDANGVCGTMIETTAVRDNISIDELKVPADYSRETYISFISGIVGDAL